MNNRMEIAAAFKPADRLDNIQSMKVLKTTTAFIELALEIESLIPHSPDRIVILRKLLSVKQDCIQAITHPFKGTMYEQKNQASENQTKKENPADPKKGQDGQKGSPEDQKENSGYAGQGQDSNIQAGEKVSGQSQSQT